ncbi:hypothetical protein RN001_005030 [Aquatica leii]|uniref:Regulatory protein zeste n=1 Tax=Aquatica leii TaxID=1421715 RepID=A0AAN7PFF4_9COLE|nr:hypothetical protein RN001_005030 [Aquatica leii]
MSVKRKRTANYTADEKNLLLSIVHKYKHIVYNQKTDSTSCQEKSKCWEKIADEFNSGNPQNVRRKADSLHRLFLNLIQLQRKNCAEERTELYKTGGGSKKNIPTNDLLISIINEKTVEGFNNPFDGDQLASSSNEGTSVTTPTADLETTFIADLNHQDIENISDEEIDDLAWQHYKPADLKRPKPPPLVADLGNSEGKSNKKNEYDAARRRPALSFVANRHISEKYNILLDHRILLTEQEVQKRKREEEEWNFLTKKHKLEIENLEADLQKKKWKCKLNN